MLKRCITLLVALGMILSVTPALAQERPTKFNEAPALAEMVAAGTLPPVEERLPKPEDILVVEPVESIGQYGGTWHRAMTGEADFHAFGRQVYEPILRWPRDTKDPIQPGIAKAWEFSEDGRELTLFLREGIKWSDGEPFTSADVTFWWEDIANDVNLTPATPGYWVVGGEPMKLEALDDFTVKLTFKEPYGLALRMLAFRGNQWPLNFERFGFFAPRHYLEQFHPKYNASADYATFNQKADDYNVERPSLTAWRITTYEPGSVVIATRNPYYWKVDPEGNQLPYIDEIRLDMVGDAQVLNLKAINGELDFQFRRVEIQNLPLLAENAEAKGYEFRLWPEAEGSRLALWFNQSYADPKYRELFQDVRFRRAMSILIDRERINQTAYLGLATPRSGTLVPQSPYYVPEAEALWSPPKPDMEQATALLEEAGLVKGSDGFYTFADGTPIELVIETSETAGARLDAIELVADDWTSAGFKVTVNTMTRDLYWPRATSNEVMVATWGTDRGVEPWVDPIYMFPYDNRSWMAPLYGVWYQTGGAEGEAPPEGHTFLKAMELYDELKVTVDADRQVEIAKEIVMLAADEVWTIGTAGLTPAIAVVKNNFHNVPQEAVSDWIYMAPGAWDPPQFWMDQE